MTQRRLLALILVAYFALGIIYSLATPPLEASDEFKHYPYTQYVQTQHNLPVLDSDICMWPGPAGCPWLQDGGQPPLYYAVMAALTSWIDTSDVHEVRWMNRHAFVGNPSQVGNKNLVIHRPEQERFPWQGAVLAIHLIRFLTLGLGAGTVLVTYLLARDLFPDQPGVALGGAALTAFTPMFLFVNGAVNNDALAAFIGCLSLLLFVRLVRDALKGPIPLWRYGLIGIVVGLFMLAKLSGLGALILLGCLLAWVSLRRRSVRPILVGLSIVVGIAALIAGWWFLRNWRLYGDPTALNVFVTIQGVRPGIPTLRDWWNEFGTFRWTYWGLFGAVNVMAPRWLYTFFDIFSLTSLIGLALWIIRQVRPATRNPQSAVSNSYHLWWIPILWAAILFVSILRWTWIYFSFQGRLIFPDIAGISTLLVVGLRQLVPQEYRARLTAGVSVLFFTIAAVLPFASIIPAYIPPESIAASDVPAEAQIEPITFGDQAAALVGAQVPAQTVGPGEPVQVVLYWQALSPVEEDYLSAVHLLGRDLASMGQVNRHPAMGMIPFSMWEPGQVWRDVYRVFVDREAPGPTRLLVTASLYDPIAGRDLEARGSDGSVLGLTIVGTAKFVPLHWPEVEPAQPLEVALADGVALEGYDLEPTSLQAGDTLTLTLHWVAQGTPARDYTVLVHLLNAEGEAVVFGDGPPMGGDYPTGMWAAGETIVDQHLLALPGDLPTGQYRLIVGMYDLETMARLTRLDGAGDSIELPTTVEVR